MRNLLASSFRRLLLSPFFYIGTVLMYLIANSTVSSNIYAIEEGYIDIISVFFSIESFVPMIIASGLMIALLIGTEFSDGTIRNKISTGSDRKLIYLSNVIVAMFITTVYYIVCVASIYLCFVKYGLFEGRTINNLWTFIVTYYISVISFISVCIALVHRVQSRTIGIIAIILWKFTVFEISLGLLNRYNQTKFIKDDMGRTVLNQFYVDEPLRKILKAILYVIPDSQQMIIEASNSAPNGFNYKIMIICSLVSIIAAVLLGMTIFNKQDLK